MSDNNMLVEAVNAAPDSASNEPIVEEVENKTPDSESSETPEPDKEEKVTKTYTQEELDAKLSRQHNRAQKRYDRQLVEMRAELTELKAAQKAAGESVTTGSAKSQEPARGDFESYEDYIEAKARYQASEAIKEQIDKLKQERAQEVTSTKEAEVRAKLEKLADKRVSDGRKEFSDFDNTIQEAFDDGVIEAGSELYFGIIESAVGHRIAMYLAKNPEEAERISNLTPRGVHREIGKLEDKFSKAPAKDKSETMETIAGSRRISKSNDPMRDDISMEEFVRMRNAEERKRRGF